MEPISDYKSVRGGNDVKKANNFAKQGQEIAAKKAERRQEKEWWRLCANQKIYDGFFWKLIVAKPRI